MEKKSRNKDLAGLFEIEEAGMMKVVGSADTISPAPGSDTVPVAKTTLPGGGQKGDATVLSAEYNDELEDTAATGVGFSD